jgi:hypothetical protein
VDTVTSKVLLSSASNYLAVSCERGDVINGASYRERQAESHYYPLSLSGHLNAVLKSLFNYSRRVKSVFTPVASNAQLWKAHDLRSGLLSLTNSLANIR